MIDPKELRLGNIIALRIEGKDGISDITGAVTAIAYDHLLMGKGIRVPARLFPTMQGVPLTPELLEKCGFVFTKDYDYKDGSKGDVFRKGNYLLNVYFNEVGYGMSWWRNGLSQLMIGGGQLVYLHQLQNLIWCLEGEDLAINL